MKKFGFTIMEVLIALAAIGVIAAVVIPTLVTNSQQNSYGSALSMAVSNFETAMRTMITAEDVSDLFETSAWRELDGELTHGNSNNAKQFMGNISDYLELTEYSGSMTDFYADKLPLKGINREEVSIDSLDAGSHAGFKSVGATEYFIYVENSTHGGNGRISDAEARTANVNLQEEAARVVIDVNGDAKPNIVGRDIFFFLLGSDGALYPYGGKDVANYNNGSPANTWNTGGAWSCTDNYKSDYGMGCTARLIERAYKMDY